MPNGEPFFCAKCQSVVCECRAKFDSCVFIDGWCAVPHFSGPWGYQGHGVKVETTSALPPEPASRPRADVQARINDLLARRALMLDYAGMKLREEDHHGTADAAMDLRDIDAELQGLRWVLGEGE